MQSFRRNTIPSEALLEIRLAFNAQFDRLRAKLAGPKLQERFRDVETFCLFIGYPRSGHSVVGSVIDAHPDAITAHRLNSLKYVELGDSTEQILYMSLLNAMRFDRAGRKLTAYSYTIEGAWQGRYRRLRVVCDQEGERNVRALEKAPGLMDRLRAQSRCRLQFIHVVRNPYDNITTMAIRSRQTLGATSERYFRLCRAVGIVKRQLPADSVLDVRHEELLAHPEEEIRRITSFLNLSAEQEYVACCKRVLYPSPHRSRDKLAWSQELIESVARRAEEYDWLSGYRYEAEA